MPYPNEHAARIKSPGLFIKDSMRSKNLAEGIRLIVGKLQTMPDKMTSQAYRFNKAIFSAAQARKWLSDNNVKYISFEAALKNIQSMEREIKLQCYRIQLSPQEIKSNIPINIMADIKEKDQHPYFRAYSVMHEGIASPRVIGENNALPTKWTRKVIQASKNILKRGVQFFIGHNSDNSTNGRQSIGEVVATFQKLIGEKLHNIAIGYFPDRLEADKYNICSIEGNILAQDYPDYSIVKDIKNISGIALGNASYGKPAFPGAIYLGAIQAFDDNGDDVPPSKNNKGKEITMTFEDVKKAIRDMNIFPHQLYTEDDLKNDTSFSKIFDNVAKAAKEGMITKSEHDEIISAKTKEIEKLVKDVSLVTAHDKLKKSLPEGLTESQKTFIDKKFKPENMDELTDESIKTFVTDAIKEYSEYASLFGGSKQLENNVNSGNDNSDDNLDEIDKIVNEVVTKPQGV